MFIEVINLILVVIIVIIQSIVGVGVLVLGTPILLLLNFSVIDAMNFLLPISIMTSLLNLLIMKFKNDSVSYNLYRLKSFFLICIPFVLIGLIILKYSNNYINYDYIVSLVILLTLIFRNRVAKILKNLPSKLNKIILMMIGIIHGMTNSGGTLLSIFLINLNKSKIKSRSEITLFYFFLALIQLILFYVVFGSIYKDYNFYSIIFYISLGVIFGNLLLKYTSESFFRKLVFVLAFISSLTLFLKNIIFN
tara:strand:+ start:579 stop:1328 length:750 start_codon:yes stop_codon:yes gene_type:complete